MMAARSESERVAAFTPKGFGERHSKPPLPPEDPGAAKDQGPQGCESERQGEDEPQ